MVQTKRLAALLLTLLALLPVPAAWAESGVVSGTTVSGTVRVYLSSIASNTSVDVSVDGSYSIGGDASRAVARGTQINVQAKSSTISADAIFFIADPPEYLSAGKRQDRVFLFCNLYYIAIRGFRQLSGSGKRPRK